MVFWAKYAYYHVKKSQNVNTKIGNKRKRGRNSVS